jgi:hypothetical protein
MSKVKVRLLCALGVLMVFAISGVAASTAAAEFTLVLNTKEEPVACGTGTIVNLCYETVEKGTALKQLSGEEEFLILLATGAITLTAAVGPTVIKCNDTVGFRTEKEITEGKPEDNNLLILQPSPLVANSTLDVILEFIECKLQGELGELCLVPEHKETKELTGTVEENENNILFKAAGGIFIEIPFTNNGANTCPATIKGTKKVTGEQLCTWSTTENPVLEDLEEHLLVCGKSELLLAEQEATFEADYGVILEHEPFWDIEET